MNHRSLTLAELGKNGVPTSKKSANRSADYDFLVTGDLGLVGSSLLIEL